MAFYKPDPELVMGQYSVAKQIRILEFLYNATPSSGTATVKAQAPKGTFYYTLSFLTGLTQGTWTNVFTHKSGSHLKIMYTGSYTSGGHTHYTFYTRFTDPNDNVLFGQSADLRDDYGFGIEFVIFETSGIMATISWCDARISGPGYSGEIGFYSFNSTPDTTKTSAWFNGVYVPKDPYGLEENETPDGGYAGFNYSGDDVDIPALPSISAANSGFVRLYNPTITEVQDLADYLWAGAFDIATYKKLFGNPMDCFLSFGIVPVTPARSTNKENIAFANMPDPGVTAYKVTDQFTELDCGSVTIDGSKYTSSAMDYGPYTKAEIFLPFCGTHSLSIDEIMDATVGVVYHMDLYTGACVAFVKITRTNSDGSTLDSVLYQFTGNILATIPLTGADHSSFIQSILFMGAAAAATVATAGGAAPEIGGAMAVGDSVSTSALGGAAISASGINAVMSMKPNVMRSGNLAANAGFLGLKTPVITLTLPNLCRPGDEEKLAGMPCQKSGTLSDFSGFNIVGACHLDNIPCTMEELRMIDEALAKGVII